MISLSEEERAIVQAILIGSPCPVGVFGSRVKGTARPSSDLDLVFLTGAPLPVELLAEYREAFAASGLPFRVDCVDYSRCGEGFKKLIDDEGQVFNSLPSIASNALLMDYTVKGSSC